MKKHLLAVLALSGVVLFGHQSTFAQDSSTQAGASQSAQIDQDILLLRKDIRSQKKQLIAANVPLTDAEAQKFWPLYDQFTQELVMINNDKYALIKEYAQSYNTMTDAQADNWTQRMLKVDASVGALRQSYFQKFRSVLTARKTALYEQVERRAQLIIDLQIASQVPLVQP